MEKDLKLEIKIADPKKCQCFKCRYNGGTGYDCNCLKYSIKPSEILYENAKCPKFKEIDPSLLEDDDEDEE